MPVVENNYASTLHMVKEAESRAMEARQKCLGSLYYLASLKLSLLQGNMKTFMSDMSSIKAVNFEKSKRRSSILNNNEEEEDESDVRDYVKLDLPRLRNLCNGAPSVQAAMENGTITSGPMALMTREFYGSDVALEEPGVPISHTMDEEIKKTLTAPIFDTSALSKDARKAQENIAKAQEYQQFCQQYIEIMDEIRSQSSLFFNCLYNMDNSWFKSVMENLHKLVGGKHSFGKKMSSLMGQKSFSSDDMELISNTVNLAQTIQQIIETDIVDRYGNFNTRNTKRMLAKVQKTMGSEISLPTSGVQQLTRELEEKFKQTDTEYAQYLKKREEEEAAARKAAEEAKRAEEARIAAEKARIAAEEAKKAEEARRAQEARIAAEKAKQAEEARKQEERRKAEEARLAAEKAKQAEEARKAQEARLDREMKAALEESRKAAQAVKQSEEAHKAAQAERAAEALKVMQGQTGIQARKAAEALEAATNARTAGSQGIGNGSASGQSKAMQSGSSQGILDESALSGEDAARKAEEEKRAAEERAKKQRAEEERKAAERKEEERKAAELRAAEERRAAELQRMAELQRQSTMQTASAQGGTAQSAPAQSTGASGNESQETGTQASAGEWQSSGPSQNAGAQSSAREWQSSGPLQNAGAQSSAREWQSSGSSQNAPAGGGRSSAAPAQSTEAQNAPSHNDGEESRSVEPEAPEKGIKGLMSKLPVKAPGKDRKEKTAARDKRESREQREPDGDNVRGFNIMDLELPKPAFWGIAAVLLLLALWRIYNVGIFSAVVLIGAGVVAMPIILDNMDHIIKLAIVFGLFILSFIMPNQIIPHESGDTLVSLVQDFMHPQASIVPAEDYNYLGSGMTQAQYELKYQNYQPSYKGQKGVPVEEVEALLGNFLYGKDGYYANNLVIETGKGKSEEYQVINAAQKSKKNAVVYISAGGKNYRLDVTKEKGNKINVKRKKVK